MNEHIHFFQVAADEAKLATCRRASCGAIIVSNQGSVIGKGHNSPPLGNETQRTCMVDDFDFAKKPKYDKTCCVHAEWNAILDACKHFPDEIVGSTLYFMRVDNSGDFTNAGEPYCTVCSRLSLESGIATFVLWNDSPQFYDTAQYNTLSYDFHKSV